MQIRWTVGWLAICSILALGGCQVEEAEGLQFAEPSQTVLRTKIELDALGLSLNSLPSCDLIDAESTQSDWDADARLRMELLTTNCSLPTEDITQEQARTTLGEDNIALTGKGDTLTIYQRTTWGEAFFCCSLQGLPSQAVIGDTVWVARQRLHQLDAANITMSANLTNLDPEGYDIQPSGLEGEAIWRGPNVPEMIVPVADEDLEGTISEHKIYSPQLNETRRISVFASAGLRPDSPVIIAADGASLGGIIEQLIRDGKIRPVLMIGVKSGQDGIVESRAEIGDTHALRSYDYFPPEVWADTEASKAGTRFDDHLSFVTETLLAWASDEFGMEIERDRTVVMGWSNGGSFAVHAAFRRNHVFGHAWPMSISAGALDNKQLAPAGPKARFRLSAGHYEPGFMYRTRISADVLSGFGYDIDTKWYAEGHGANQWYARFSENLQAVFPKEN